MAKFQTILDMAKYSTIADSNTVICGRSYTSVLIACQEGEVTKRKELSYDLQNDNLIRSWFKSLG